jgi:hypothetical protein
MRRVLLFALCVLVVVLWFLALREPASGQGDPEARVAALEADLAYLRASSLPEPVRIDVREALANPRLDGFPFDPTFALGMFCVIREPMGLDPLLAESLDQYIVVCARPAQGSTLHYLP